MFFCSFAPCHGHARDTKKHEAVLGASNPWHPSRSSFDSRETEFALRYTAHGTTCFYIGLDWTWLDWTALSSGSSVPQELPRGPPAHHADGVHRHITVCTCCLLRRWTANSLLWPSLNKESEADAGTAKYCPLPRASPHV